MTDNTKKTNCHFHHLKSHKTSRHCILKMDSKISIAFLLLISTFSFVSNVAGAENPKDLATDIPIAQNKLAVFIQEALRFSSSYQVITDADVKIEVSNNFGYIYLEMEALQINEAIINQIKGVAAQDIGALAVVTANFLNANNEILATAYEMNRNLRNNNLTDVPALFNKFTVEDLQLFNAEFDTYLQTLTYTTNTVELLILSAIIGMEGQHVTNINALMQKSNDLINSDAERMVRELVYFDHDYTEAANAVFVVVEQIPAK